MSRRITLLLVVLIVVLLIVLYPIRKARRAEQAYYKEMSKTITELTDNKSRIELELNTLEREYNGETADGAASIEFVFLGAYETVYTEVYSIMNGYSLTGTLAVTESQMPGGEGCMSVEQCREMLEGGWELALAWEWSDAPSQDGLADWLDRMQSRLQELGLADSVSGMPICFPEGFYAAELDGTLTEYGCSIALCETGTVDNAITSGGAPEGVWSPRAFLWQGHLGSSDVASNVRSYSANFAFAINWSEVGTVYGEERFTALLDYIVYYADSLDIAVTSCASAQALQREATGQGNAAYGEYIQKKTRLEQELAEAQAALEEAAEGYRNKSND